MNFVSLNGGCLRSGKTAADGNRDYVSHIRGECHIGNTSFFRSVFFYIFLKVKSKISVKKQVFQFFLASFIP